MKIVSGVCVALMTAAAVHLAAQSDADKHVAAAKTAAATEFKAVYDRLCAPPEPEREPAGARRELPPPPPKTEWYAEPGRVFDNLYFVGTSNVSAYALTTSEGIILIDSTYDYSVEASIVGGLKKVGLDPAQIKYVIVTHAHRDHVAGAKLLQERGARIVMSAEDWHVLATNPRDPGPQPKKDIAVSDGQKLTLGDTTVAMYLTPGHTPGTISLILPVKDGNKQHVAAMWGGMSMTFPRTAQNYDIFINAAKKFANIVADSGAEVILGNHTYHDGVLEKMPKIAARKQGDPHPFVVGREGARAFMTMITECGQATKIRALGHS
jgi:metallo-beta-lactamase class B